MNDDRSTTEAAPRLYSLLVCPRCRRALNIGSMPDSEGMHDRAGCCGSWWMRPEDVGENSPSAALRIYAVEAAR